GRAARHRTGRDRGRGRLPQGHHRARRRGGLPGPRHRRRPRNPRGAAGPLARLRAPGDRLRAGRRRARRRPADRDLRRDRGGRPMSAPSTTRRGRPARDGGGDGPRGTAPALHRSADSALGTIRRGLELSPEFTRGLGWTLLFAVIATAGKVVVPMAVQQIIDNGIGTDGATPDMGFVATAVGLCTAALLVTALCSYLMNVRLYRATESGLVTLRRKAFRHVHDLSVLTQNSERKGALVSRVTADVDQISTFMQWGGLLLIVSSGQLVIATVLMAVYSWQLTLVVWVCFLPLLYGARWLQGLL